MRKLLILASLIAAIACSPAFSEDDDAGSMELKVFCGLSTPMENVNAIYNESTLEGEDIIGRLYKNGVSVGYHFGVGIRLPLTESFKLTGGIAWNRFPESTINVVKEVNGVSTGEVLVTLYSVQNIFPINAGIAFYPIQTDLLGIYATGELTYNLFSNTVDYANVPLNLSIPDPDSDGKGGIGIGAGIDLDISILKCNLEVKYNVMNLVGKETGEKTKDYLTLSLGVVF